jgi:hypothetical protein
MARHDQRPSETKMTCLWCNRGKCTECIDILRIIAGLDTICNCKLPNHAGEPRDQQVLDPETGVVHAPGLTVDPDGTVTRHE